MIIGRIKNYIFWKAACLIGRLIKDEEYIEEYYELIAEIVAQDVF